MSMKPSIFALGLALGLSTLLPSQAEAHRRWLLPPGRKPALLAPLPARIVTQPDVFESKAWLSWKS